jgi:ATP-dependent helicase Lhr and Lhr-like helicase
VASLRAMHRQSESAEEEPECVQVAAADPMNLAGIIVPGERVAAVPGRCIQYRDGVVFTEAGVAVTDPVGRKREILLPAIAVGGRVASLPQGQWSEGSSLFG